MWSTVANTHVSDLTTRPRDHFISSLDMSLGLHESAHDAEGAEEGSVAPLGGQAGDDGVVGPLGRGQAVGMALHQGKVGAPGA